MDYTQCTPNPRKNKHLCLTARVKIELMLQEDKTTKRILIRNKKGLGRQQGRKIASNA